jgi:hypothetical protein
LALAESAGSRKKSTLGSRPASLNAINKKPADREADGQYLLNEITVQAYADRHDHTGVS